MKLHTENQRKIESHREKKIAHMVTNDFRLKGFVTVTKAGNVLHRRDSGVPK